MNDKIITAPKPQCTKEYCLNKVIHTINNMELSLKCKTSIKEKDILR